MSTAGWPAARGLHNAGEGALHQRQVLISQAGMDGLGNQLPAGRALDDVRKSSRRAFSIEPCHTLERLNTGTLRSGTLEGIMIALRTSSS